jgi:hypothetical protein
VTEKVIIVFIGGFGRSGSTLLDRILGQIDGFFSVGEFRHIWQRSFLENQLCGCGEPFKSCHFWSAVSEEMSGDIGVLDIEEVAALQRTVDRARNIPAILQHSKRSTNFGRAFHDYVAILDSFYRAIRKVSRRQVIVDSSKDPSHGFLLTQLPSVDLRAAHLVRDGRAVAYSWQRRRVRPEIHWRQEYMARYSVLKSAAAWDITNGLMEWLGHVAPRYTRVSYEELVGDPKRTIGSLLEDLNLAAPALDFISNQAIVLDRNHTVSGNPMRFRVGDITLRLDDEWRGNMSFAQRLVLCSLTWPLLWRYGYIGRL